MSDLPLILNLAVFAASALQAMSGIGFGVLAGPVLIVVLDSYAAIQISILLSFLIAVLLVPTMLGQIHLRLLVHLLLGVCAGTPLGVMAAAVLDFATLKLVAALVVGFMTVVASGLYAQVLANSTDSTVRRGAVGAISGALNVSLAMPGPPVAAYMTAIVSGKEKLRATTLALFLVAYPLAFAAQAFGLGITAETWTATLDLAPATIAGTLLGLFLARSIGEPVFRHITVACLAASAGILLFG